MPWLAVIASSAIFKTMGQPLASYTKNVGGKKWSY